MVRDPRFDILFEPVKIGPVTARNRFYQVPHGTGMGFDFPHEQAAHREVKAEGGWGVVCTEECMFHMTSEYTPNPDPALFDDGDIPAMALIAEGIHRHSALAGIELVHHGMYAANRISREVPIGPSSRPNVDGEPVHTRAMDKADIREFRRWHPVTRRSGRSALATTSSTSMPRTAPRCSCTSWPSATTTAPTNTAAASRTARGCCAR